MKKLLMLLAITSTFAFLTGCAAIKGAFTPTASDILKANRDNIASARTRKNIDSALLTYEQTSADGKGTLRIYFKEPNLLRIENIINEDANIATLNGSNSWAFADGKIFDLSDEDIEEMSEYLDLLPFHEKPDEFFEKCILMEDTEYATGAECYVIHAQTDDELPVTIWITKDDKMIAQIEVQAPEGKYTTQYFEFKEVEKVKVPSRMYIFDPVEGAMLLVLQEAEINTLDDSAFECPVTFDKID